MSVVMSTGRVLDLCCHAYPRLNRIVRRLRVRSEFALNRSRTETVDLS